MLKLVNVAITDSSLLAHNKQYRTIIRRA